MNWKRANRKTHLNLAATVILLSGLTGSAVIYLNALGSSDTPPEYEFEGTKQYLHDLELYGGKANVLAAEFWQWFNGLWHGKSLAFTLAFITILISLGLFFVAHHTPSAETGSDNRNGIKRYRTYRQE